MYESQLRLHILPALGDLPLNRITPTRVADWWYPLHGDDGPGECTAAKVYRLLKQILGAAVSEELIPKNPCTIRGAGQEPESNREGPPVEMVLDLLDVLRPERRLLVLFGAFTGLRLAELLALHRRHVDPLGGRLIVEESTVETRNGTQLTKPPKSDAGRRTVHLDPEVMAEVEAHLETHVAFDPDAYLFTGDRGGQLRRGVWHKEWTEARADVGASKYVFHDLRHTAGTLLAELGVTLKESMRRLGQSTSRAALRYQDAVESRDKTAGIKVGDHLRQARSDRAARDRRTMDA